MTANPERSASGRATRPGGGRQRKRTCAAAAQSCMLQRCQAAWPPATRVATFSLSWPPAMRGVVSDLAAIRRRPGSRARRSPHVGSPLPSTGHAATRLAVLVSYRDARTSRIRNRPLSDAAPRARRGRNRGGWLSLGTEQQSALGTERQSTGCVGRRRAFAGRRFEHGRRLKKDHGRTEGRGALLAARRSLGTRPARESR